MWPSQNIWTLSLNTKNTLFYFFSDFITNKKPNPERKEEFSEFMIEKSGDENLLKRKVDDGENVKEKKKKKKIAKSYLDDLWIINIKKNKCNKFLPNFVTNVPLAMCILDFFCWNIRFGNNLCLFTKSHFFISSWKNLERHCEVMSIMINHNLTRFSYFYFFIIFG